MAKSTHDKELERARARRADERAEKKRATVLVVVLVAVLVVGAIVFGGVLLLRGDDVSPDASDAADATTSTSTEPADGASTAAGSSALAADPCPAPTGDLPSPRDEVYETQPTVDLGDVETVTVTLVTTCGDVVLRLDAASAPATVGNFVALAEDGYYEGVGFHRVIQDFMIQGGDPTGTGTGCLDAACEQKMPGYQLDDELALAEEVVASAGGYPRGTVAMANAGPNTNGSQFFIVQADPSYPLPAAYAVFGEVESGMDVVDRIVVGPSAGDQAIEPVIILSVSVVR